MRQNEILVLTAKLFLITAVTALILGGAYQVTKAPIAKQIEKTNNDAMRETLSQAESFKKLDLKEGIVTEVNEALKGTNVVGYAIKVTPKGYGGIIEIMVGISKEGKVEGIKILSQSETPGLGANATLPSFYERYKGKALTPALQVVKTAPSNPNEIQALTGATITSRAVTLGVNEAITVYNKVSKGGQK